MSTHDKVVWVFNGAGARFPSGIFSSKERAARWIEEYKLSGMLTAYPIDEGVLDWAIRTGVFRPKGEKHTSSEFIQGFTTGGQDHVHYEQGKET
jgi:hypothetical protein